MIQRCQKYQWFLKSQKFLWYRSVPEVPVVPDDPEEPEEPLDPEVPEVPVVPEDPEVPDVPEVPGSPLSPVRANVNIQSSSFEKGLEEDSSTGETLTNNHFLQY